MRVAAATLLNSLKARAEFSLSHGPLQMIILLSFFPQILIEDLVQASANIGRLHAVTARSTHIPSAD